MKLYKLFEKKVFNINPGLERIRKASQEIGSPHEKLNAILISGTNGKGSTSAFLESLFRHHNLKTGMFTSPHIVEENERWQINKISITNEELEYYIKLIKPLIEKYELTYFEASALIAFKYFADKNVDIAILEVGLGGRWDATNIVEPLVSTITNVSFDHTHLLGNTLESIAFEKLGIARENVPLVIGSNQDVLYKEALEKGIKEIYQYAKDFLFQDVSSSCIDYQFKNYSFKNLKLSLLGRRQHYNAATALTTFLVYAERYNIKPVEKNIRLALSNTFLPARMQILSTEPLIILDGAHNEDAILNTFKEVKTLFPDKKINTVFSGMKDKDLENILKIVKGNSHRIVFTQIPVSRSISKENIKDETFVEDINRAIRFLVNQVKEDEIILITGSLYLAGEVLKDGWNTTYR